MTEKRFNFVGGYLYDGNKPIGHVEDIKFRQDFEDIVNALHDENEQLKQENKKLHDTVFSLRTELAHQRTEKEEHSDSAYTFLKKLEKW